MKKAPIYLLILSLVCSLFAEPTTESLSQNKENSGSDIHSFLKTIETKDKLEDKSTPSPTSLVPGETKTSLISQMLILGVLCIGAVILAIRFKQKGFSAFKIRKTDGKLKISEIKDLGNRQFLVVVEYETQKILLGVTPGNITNLGPLVSPFSDPEFLNEDSR